MRRISTVMVMAITLVLSTVSVAFGAVNGVTPSTNDENAANGWAHFEVVGTRVGEVDIEFISSRDFSSCFEYRSDGEAPDYGDGNQANFNPAVEDGLWDFVCVSNETATMTLRALEYVEIRMVFGAETDERFDWTRVDVQPVHGAKGLQIASAGPAGERADENARFKQGNEHARFNR